MNSTVTTSEKLRAVWRVIRYAPLLGLGVVGTSLLVAVLEGVGIGFLLPIVEHAAEGSA